MAALGWDANAPTLARKFTTLYRRDRLKKFFALLSAQLTIPRTLPKSLAARAQAGKAQAQRLAEPEGVDRVIVVSIAGIRMDQN